MNREHSSEYIEHLQSPEWRETRMRVLVRASGRCERCNALVPSDKLQVHHKTYDNLGDEPLDDLLALCVICHILADKARKMKTEQDRRDRAVHSYMEKKYGDDWFNDRDDTEARRWLARKNGEEWHDEN